MKFIFLLIGITMASTLIAMTPVKTPTDSNIITLFNEGQGKHHRIFTSTPTVRDLDEGEFVVLNTTPTKAIFTKIGGVLWNWKLLSN